VTVPSDAIHGRGLRLWARVGIFEQDRRYGPWFELEFCLGGELGAAAEADDLAGSLDDALAITSLQRQSRTVRCLRIEQYSRQILDQLEQLDGPIAIRRELGKCQPPIPGFQEQVSVLHQRRWGGFATADG
jgi:dihydroneopterin aldolase